jgi:hypothetical protein
MSVLNLSVLSEGSPVNGIQTNRAFLRGVAITSTTGLPTEYELTVAAVDVNDVTASITVPAEPAGQKVFLDAGTVLTLTTGSITVAVGTEVTSAATTVPIFPATAAASGTTTVWGMARLSCSEIGNWNQDVGMVSTKLLGNGEQDSDERVSVTWEMTANLIIYPNDVGYYKHILPSADNHAGFTGRMFLFGGMPCDNAGNYEYAFGPALVRISADPAPVNEVRRPVLTAKWQSPYRKTTRYADETTARKAEIVAACKAAGLKPPA